MIDARRCDFDIEIDEEGVCRVMDHAPDEMMMFTVQDFGRFLTEFIYTHRQDAEDEDD